MVRRHPLLTSLLAALLLLQWGTAFAHCLRLRPVEAFVLEICTPDGIHRMALDEEGGERKARPVAVCPACLGPAAVAPPPPVALAAPLLLVQAADPPPVPPSSPRPAPTPYCQPRAPPTS